MRLPSSTLLPFLFSSVVRSQPGTIGGEATTCSIAGIIYQSGEILTIASRCGPVDDFPCYCDPLSEPPIYCPYCTFVSEDGELVCGKDGDIVSFTNTEGDLQTCGCSIGTGTSPVTDCAIGGEVPTVPQTNTCTYDLADGSSISLSPGDSLVGVFENNRCGEGFPCVCQPDAPGQISCPYCRFPSFGGELTCAQSGQRISFRDEEGINQSCSCSVGPSGEPLSNCMVSADISPIGAPAVSPTGQMDVCVLQLEGSDQVVTFQNGESYGDYLSSRCGSSEDFPCFCNPAVENQIECPYCTFVTDEGDLRCAKDSESISFQQSEVWRTCSCTILSPFDAPIESCSDSFDIPPTPSPMTIRPDGTAPSNCIVTDTISGQTFEVEHGESFGNMVEASVCGPVDEWPAICNVALSTAGVSRNATGNHGVEYPYCIFENTQSGSPICAKSGSQVTFVDDQGVTQGCSCVYLSPALGGSQTSCNPVIVDSPPTDSPTIAPTTASNTCDVTLIVPSLLASISLVVLTV